MDNCVHNSVSIHEIRITASFVLQFLRLSLSAMTTPQTIVFTAPEHCNLANL